MDDHEFEFQELVFTLQTGGQGKVFLSALALHP